MTQQELSDYIKSLNAFKAYKYADYDLGHNAITLPPKTGIMNGGWLLYAEIIEDYYEWINEFEAYHVIYGAVWGDYEQELYGESLEAIQQFIKYNPPDEWDYYEI